MQGILRWAYERDAQGTQHFRSGDVAQDLALDLRAAQHALERLGERGHVRFLSRTAPEHWIFAITEAGREAVEDEGQGPPLHWKQEVHGQAANQVGHHNTINFYGAEFLPSVTGQMAQIATPAIRFSVHQVGRWHTGIFMANLNPYPILLESLRYEQERLDLRGFEWTQSPVVQERLPPTARSYLATVKHEVASINNTHVLPLGEWTFAVKFVTTARPEEFEAQVRYSAQAAADQEDPTVVTLLTQEVIKLG